MPWFGINIHVHVLVCTAVTSLAYVSFQAASYLCRMQTFDSHMILFVSYWHFNLAVATADVQIR